MPPVDPKSRCVRDRVVHVVSRHSLHLIVVASGGILGGYQGGGKAREARPDGNKRLIRCTKYMAIGNDINMLHRHSHTRDGIFSQNAILRPLHENLVC